MVTENTEAGSAKAEVTEVKPGDVFQIRPLGFFHLVFRGRKDDEMYFEHEQYGTRYRLLDYAFYKWWKIGFLDRISSVPSSSRSSATSVPSVAKIESE
jgi:hypothetical protein